MAPLLRLDLTRYDVSILPLDSPSPWLSTLYDFQRPNTHAHIMEFCKLLISNHLQPNETDSQKRFSRILKGQTGEQIDT